MKFSFKKCAIAVLAAASIAFGAAGASACAKKSVAEEVTGNIEITKTPAPTDGSLPTAHSGEENLAYIAAVLDAQTKWHSYGYTVTSASIATQVTRTWKDYSDGILITSDVTYSSMVKSGSQTCTVKGDDGAEIYFRASETPDASTTNLSAKWDTNPPTYYAQSGFLKTYGLLQTELSSYIINDESIAECSEVTVNSDGTYTQSFVLDPSLSTYYYQYGMKTRGGLAAFPSFESVSLSVTFDASWRVLSLTTRDVSQVNKGVVVKSVSDTTTVFSYGDDGFEEEHFAYYDSYYAGYIGDASLDVGGNVEEELVLDVTNILSNGFAKILSGGDQFKASVKLGNKTYVGYIFVGLDLEDIAGSINVKLSLGKDYDNQSLYVEYADGNIRAYYGEDFAIGCNIAETKLAIGQLEQFISGFAGALENIVAIDASSDEGGDALADLMNSLVLETGENKATLILETDDLLGLGVGIDAKLDFGVSNNSITFRNCDIYEISLGGEALDLSLNLKVSSADVISRDETTATADLAEYIADVNALLSSDLIKVSATLDGDAQGVNLSALKGLKVALDAYCDIDGITVGADLAVSYIYNGSPISAKASVWYDYEIGSSGYGTAIISLKELNGKAVSVKVRCDIADLVEGISSALIYSGATFGGSTDSLVSVINGAFNADFEAILTELYADNSNIKVGLNIDALLDVLNIDIGIKFGSCSLVYERGDASANGGKLSASLPAMGFGVEISGADGQLTRPDDADCLDLSYVLEDIEKFANAELYKAEITFDGAQATGLGISELAGLKAQLTAYLDAQNITVGANAVVSYTYKTSTITVDISVWYDNANGNVIVKLNKLNDKATDLSMYVNVEELSSAVSGLIGATGTTTDGLNIDLDSVIANLLSADFNELLPELSTSANGLRVTVNADKLLEVLGANVGITLGNIDLAYAHGDTPVLTANAAALGLGVSIIPESGNIELPDIENALNISYVLADIEKFANAELYKAEITFDGAQATGLGISELAGLKAQLTAYLDAQNITVGANAVVAYTYKNSTITVDISVWYDNANGNVIVKLNKLNDKTTDLSMYVNVEEISSAVSGLIGATGTTADGLNIDLDEVIANLLSADFNELLPELSTSANGLRVSVNADKLLEVLGANVGLTLGNIDLAYAHGDTPVLTANAAALGLGVSIIPESGNIELPDIENALNISYVLADIEKFANAELYKAEITFDGAQATGLGIAELAGFRAQLTAYLDASNITVGANAVVEYTYKTNTITVDISVWYDNANGNVIVKLNKLNDKTTDLSMYVNVEEISSAVSGLIGATGTTTDGLAIDLDEVIANLLSADFNELLPELSTNASGLKVSVNADKLLEVLGANVGLTLGNIDLAYAHGDTPVLTANAAALGLGVSITPESGNIELPDIENALNISYVLADIEKFANAELYKAEITFDGGQATGLGISELAGLRAQLTAYLDASNITVGTNAVVSYTYKTNTITVDISVWYDNANGNVIVKLNKLNDKATDLSMYVNVEELSSAVSGLIGATGTTTDGLNIDLDSVIANLLSADFNELLPELSTSANGLRVTVNADKLLEVLGANVGITLGNIDLAYAHGDTPVLTANAGSLGLAINVIPESGNIELPDIENALNISYVLADIEKFANAELYKAEITFDGAQATGLGIAELAGLKAQLTAYLDAQNITVGANAVVAYTYKTNTITVDISVWYDNANGNVIVKLNKLNDKTTDLSMYVNVEEISSAVSGLIGATGTTADGLNIDLDSIIANLLSADFNELLPELSTSANGLRVTVNADKLLEVLGANVGLTLGNIDLAYAHGDTPVLTANAAALGLNVSVVPESGEVELPDIENALNISYVLEDIEKFANAELYKAEITFDGAQATGLGISELAGLRAQLTAYLDASNITVGANAVVEYTYKTNTIKVDISVWYDNANGNVIVKLNKLNDKTTDLSMYVNVEELSSAVSGLIGATGTTTDGLAIDLDEVIANLLSADFNELLPELSTSANGLKVSVNADKLLEVLGANVGLTLGNIDLVYAHGDTPVLTANAAALGLNVSVVPESGDVELPDIENALSISYVLEDIEKFANAELYKAEITFDGAQATGLGIAELAGFRAQLTAYLDASNITVGANAVVEYTYKTNTITVDISVWYDNANGNVIVKLNKLNDKTTDLSMYVNVEEISSAVSGLIGATGTTTDGFAIDLDEVIANLLSADFNKLLPELSTSASGLRVSVNADKLIEVLGANVGITLGNIDLAYAHGDTPVLTANAAALGLGVSIIPESGNIELPDIENALNIAYVIEDIEKFANAELYKAEITFDGAQATGLGIAELAGLKAQLTAYLDAQNITVGANLTASYTYSGNTVSADFTVWYDYDAQRIGDVYLTLNSINGVATSISVKCDISELSEAVKELMEMFSLEQSTEIATDFGKIDISDVAADILSADFERLLPDIRTFADGASMTIDADYLLTLLGANVGIKLGNIDLAYSYRAHGLTLAANSLGLNAAISTASEGITQPKPVDACELSDLVKLINSTVNQVKTIIDEKLLSFTIDRGQTYIEADGIRAEIFGEGEISWSAGGTYVALDLGLSLEESAADVTEIKFVYIQNPADNMPAIRLVIGNVGIDVYPEDIELLQNKLDKIYSTVEGLLPSATQTAAKSTAPLIIEDESEGGKDALMAVIFKALATTDWVEALGDMSLTFDENSLLLTYLKENALSFALTDDGAMAVDYSGKVAGFALGGSLNVSRGSANLISAIDNCVSGGDYTISSTRKQGSQEFTKLVYDFLFDAVSSVAIDNILGSDTYTVKFELIGDNSGMAELGGVNVLAAMYITGEQGERGKIAEADLELSVKGVDISLNVIAERTGGETYFYINLAQVLNFKMPDLKVTATQSSLYDTLKVLISAVTDTSVISVIGSLLPEYEFSSVEGFGSASVDIDDETLGTIADVIDKLLNFNFSQAFTAVRVDDVTTATIDFDNIASQLGLSAEGLGCAEAVINHRDHSIKSSAKAEVLQPDGSYEVKEWLYLLSEKTARRDYSSFDRNDYINIEFLPDLLSDLVKFATDDEGNVYGSFTLSGKITANIVSLISIQIDISTLTVSFNEGQGFYFTLIGQLSGGVVSNNTIGITYENGYLTLAKGLNGSSPEYKIMTFEYFIDHMFSTDGSSTLNYLLGVSNLLWKTVVNSLGDLVKLDSGITTPEEIFLYAAKTVEEDEEISMYDFIEALRVIVNGSETAVIGDYSVIEDKLGIYDNYYGFSLNAGAVTDDVLTELIAAIVRDDATGISGIRAYGAIQSYVSFNVNLDYTEGLTPVNSYEIGTELEHGKYAPSLYKAALSVAEENGVTIDFDHYVKNPSGGYDETFGCFSTNGLKTEYSHELYRHTLTIVALDGTAAEREVRHGSTIHTYDNSSPVYTADGFRLLYSFTAGGDVADSSFLLNGDTVLYEVKRQAVRVYVVNGSQTATVNSFVGDLVPTSVNGLDAVDGPYYSDGTAVNSGDRISAGTDELWLYGTFAQSEVTVNYVKYTFDAATRTYAVSGKAAGFNDYYSVKGNTLVLENEINGYPVTAIADYALANSDGKPIKSVVVPANITTIGAGAFLDNYGMESAVFLADSVTMCGDLKSMSMPFYGCSTVQTSENKANEKTILNIYYNSVTNGNMDWTNFRIVEPSPAIIYYMYVGNDPNTSEWINYNQNGGGALHTEGSWTYVTSQVNADAVTEISVEELVAAKLTTGLIEGAYGGKDELRSYIEGQLSQYKNDYGQDKYVTEVTTGRGTDGSLQVTVNVSLNIPTVVTMYSAVDMTYNGTDIAAGAQTKVSVVKSGDCVTLFQPEAVGYTFIGWAADVDGQLVFTDKTAEYFGEDYVYYAIWGTSKVSASFSASVNYSGTSLSLPSGNGIDGKWYDAYWNEVTSLSYANTVVYTRSVFAVTYSVSGNLITNLSDSLGGYDGTTSSYSNSFNVLEGQTVTATRSSDGYSMTITADGETVTTMTLKKIVFVRYKFKEGGANLGAITSDGALSFTY